MEGAVMTTSPKRSLANWMRAMANAILSIVSGALGEIGVLALNAEARKRVLGISVRTQRVAAKLVILVWRRRSVNAQGSAIRSRIVLGLNGKHLDNARQLAASQ